ncbi:MAG: MFS transporter [Candidatus Saccharibacteria bacterium]|nr:MFS transporter [Candidatus Saccharibacteria bacterium]
MTTKQRLTLAATILGSGIVILDGTVVNIALPHISSDLGAGFSGLQWIVNGYLLTLSALLLLGGSLGDIFGRKKMYVIGLVGFGLSSLLCGLAPSTSFLVAARALQGVFGALLVPGGLANITANFEKSARAGAIGTWTAWSALSAAIGPTLGGYIVDTMSWRWIFIINVPLVIVCCILAVLGMKESRSSAKARRIDVPGAGFAAISLAGLTYGLIEGPNRQWDGVALLSIGIGVLAILAFLWRERQTADPMVKLQLFGSRNFSGANLMTFTMYGALSAFLFALVIHLQTVLGYSGTKAGLSLIPITAMLLLLSARAGRLAGQYGPRRFMTAGPIIASIGILYLYGLESGAGYLTSVLPGVLLFATGLAVTVSPLTITVMGAVADEDSGIASGINNAVSRVAGLVTVAVLGLFDSSKLYQSTIVLCFVMTFAAGLLSLWLIRTPQKEV